MTSCGTLCARIVALALITPARMLVAAGPTLWPCCGPARRMTAHQPSSTRCGFPGSRIESRCRCAPANAAARIRRPSSARFRREADAGTWCHWRTSGGTVASPTVRSGYGSHQPRRLALVPCASGPSTSVERRGSTPLTRHNRSWPVMGWPAPASGSNQPHLTDRPGVPRLVRTPTEPASQALLNAAQAVRVNMTELGGRGEQRAHWLGRCATYPDGRKPGTAVEVTSWRTSQDGSHNAAADGAVLRR
jgi:hypothetical protein